MTPVCSPWPWHARDGNKQLSRDTPRLAWGELPAEVRAGVELVLGEPVIEAISQPYGFSPGSADRVRLASGKTAFVKAASSETNAHAAALHRQEAVVSAALPSTVPAPALLGVYDAEPWVALILAEVPGRHPEVPWRERDVKVVLDAVYALSRTRLPADLELVRLEDALAEDFQSWERLAETSTPVASEWANENMELLARMAREGLPATAGQNLVHSDLRADNVLLTDAGAVLIDWPWAARGASWTDGMSVLINVVVTDPQADIDHWLDEHPLFAQVGENEINGVAAGLSGYFLATSLLPDPPGLPTLRAFQQVQGQRLIDWLERRVLASQAPFSSERQS